MINVDVLDFKSAQDIQGIIEQKKEELGLYDVCKHTILNIVRHSKTWRYPQLSKMIENGYPLYQPETDHIFLLYMHTEEPHMGLFPVVDFNGYKKFFRDASKYGFKII